MLRRINKQSCRNSLHPLREVETQGPTKPLPESRFGSLHRQASHKKYYSTFSSMGGSPLCVRRQALRDKEKEKPLALPKEARITRKQKTEHFNHKYFHWMRMRRQGMNWIQYNMTLGVAYLWKKVQEQITNYQQAKKIKYNQKFQQQVVSINQQIDEIIQENNLRTPSAQKQDFAKLFQGRNSAQFKALSFNLAQVQKKISSKGIHTYYKSRQTLKKLKSKEKGLGSTAAATPNKEVSLNRLKESVCKLNSFFCLFKRRISLQKEDQLINEFVERRSSNISLSPKELQELQQIMKINQQRCQLMNEIIHNVGLLRTHKSSLHMSQEILKKIGEIDLVKQLGMTAQHNREEILKAKMRSCNNIIIQVTTQAQESQNPTGSINMLQDSTIFNQELCEKTNAKINQRKDFQRSSIQNLVSPQKENNYNAPSKFNLVCKEKVNQRSNKFVKQDKEKGKKVNKSGIQLKKASLKKSTHFVEAQKDKDKHKQKDSQRRPKKRTIGFAGVQEEGKVLTQKQSIRSKMKSAKSIKSKREITWDDLQRHQYRSLKSVKSLRSLKSIGSCSSLGSRKILRSMKTQRQMKYLHGHLREIQYISKYRTKLFKLKGLEDENPHQLRDFFDATTDNREESQVQLDQQDINDFEQQQRSRQSIELAIATPSQMENMESINKSIPEISQQSLKIAHKQICKIEQVSDWASQKDAIIQQFLKKFSIIEREGNIAKQKYLILIQLQKMLDGKVISAAMFERYRTYFDGQRRSTDCAYSQKLQLDSDKKLRPSHYSNLLNFRKLIQNTTGLNQINKYYYNISQFRVEEEQINNTKKANKRDDFFFHIRNFTEQHKKKKDLEYYREERQQLTPKVLQQKAI